MRKLGLVGLTALLLNGCGDENVSSEKPNNIGIDMNVVRPTTVKEIRITDPENYSVINSPNLKYTLADKNRWEKTLGRFDKQWELAHDLHARYKNQELKYEETDPERSRRNAFLASNQEDFMSGLKGLTYVVAEDMLESIGIKIGPEDKLEFNLRSELSFMITHLEMTIVRKEGTETYEFFRGDGKITKR